MRKLFIAALFAITLLTAGCSKNNPISSENYPVTLIVTRVNEETDTVTTSTATGFVYEFSGVEDWIVGDLCSVIMNDNGTPETIADDQIEKYQYSGYTELYDWLLLEAVEHYYE